METSIVITYENGGLTLTHKGKRVSGEAYVIMVLLGGILGNGVDGLEDGESLTFNIKKTTR